MLAFTLGTTALVEPATAGFDSDVLGASSPTDNWTVSSNDGWLHVNPALASGQGSATILFSYDPNTGAGARTGSITIAGQTLDVTQAGTSYQQANYLTGLVTQVPGLNEPWDVAVDAADNVFIADTGNGDIKELVAATGVIKTLVTGLYDPGGVAVDQYDNVYFADTYDHVIGELVAATGQVVTLVTDGSYPPYLLADPESLAVDSQGNVYVANTNYWNGSGYGEINEYVPSTQQWLTLVSSDLDLPAGVAVDSSGNVYIADTFDDAVKEYNASTQQVTTLVSGLDGVEGISVDPSGNVFYTEPGDSTLAEWIASSRTTKTIIAQGDGLYIPYGVAVDANDNLFIADTYDGVVKELVASTQQLDVLAGSGLIFPFAATVDNSGNVYIANTSGGSLVEWNAATDTSTVLLSDLNTPSAVAVDADGNIYTTTGGNVIEYVASSSSVVTLATGLGDPDGLALDPDGNLYIAEGTNFVIDKWIKTTDTLESFLTFPTFQGSPGGLALDAAGNLYIANSSGGEIQEWVAATGTLTIVLSGLDHPQGVAVDGSGNIYTADQLDGTIDEWIAASNKLTTLATVGEPLDVAVDDSGNVYICDTGDNVIDELARAFVAPPTTTIGPASGNGAFLLLPTTEILPGPLAPTSDQSWLTIGASGGGVINYSYAANPTSQSQTANVSVLGLTLSVTQTGTFALGTTSLVEPATAGSDTDVLFDPSGDSPWSPTVSDSWLHVDADPSGTGNALFQFSFDANPGAAARTGTITIAGQTLTVTQAGLDYLAANDKTTLVATPLSAPTGLAVDGAGNVYSDSLLGGQYTLNQWNVPSQTATPLLTGSDVLGGLTVDSAGNVYVADTTAGTVTEWVASTQTPVTLISGLSGPLGLVIDAAGNVYISQQNGTIAEWINSTQTLVPSLITGFSAPGGVAVDVQGNVYIADTGHGSIKKWNSVTHQVSTVVGGLGSPNSVAVDGSGNVYFSDKTRGIVEEWVARTGQTVSLASGLSSPAAVAVDNSNNVYYDQLGEPVDELVRAYVGPTTTNLSAAAGDGALETVLPTTETLFGPLYPTSDQSWLGIGTVSGADVSFTVASNDSLTPRTGHIDILGQQLAINQSGAIFTLGTSALVEAAAAGTDTIEVGVDAMVAWTATTTDSWLHVTASGDGSGIASFTFDANPLAATRTGTLMIAGLTLTVTQVGTNYVAADFFTALVHSSDLSFPIGIAADSSGNIYVADSSAGALKEWVAATNTVITLATGIGPGGVAIDGAGNVYIADYNNSAIEEWTGSSLVTLVQGLNHPNGVAVDQYGNLYIADTYNDAIEEWVKTTGTLKTLLNGSQVNYPNGVAVDTAGDVYVADTYNYEVEEWDPRTNDLTTLASNLSYPNSVAVDGSGDVYITDTFNYGVKEYVAATGTLTSLNTSGLTAVFGVAVDSLGDVYVSDTDDELGELARAYVGPTTTTIGSGAGNGSLLAVLPTGENLLPPFAPTSDQSWLTIGTISDGVVNYSVTANDSASERTANISLLGQQLAITQQAGVVVTAQFDTATESVDENAGTFTMTVDLSAASTDDVSIPFSLSGTALDGTNFSGVTTSPLVIPAGSTSGTITGTILDDGLYNTTNNTLIVTLGTPTGATLGAATTDTLTIDESDPEPTVSFDMSTQSVNEDAGSFSMTVSLSAASGVDTTIPFTLSGTAVDGTNYNSVTASPLVIPAGSISGTVTGAITDDGLYYTTNSTLIVTLGTPTNATLGTTTSDTLTIDESDPKPSVSFELSSQSASENSGAFSMTVDLSAVSGVDTTIPFTLSGTAVDGTNYGGVTTSPLVIPAGMMSGTITGTLFDDGLYFTTNHTLVVTLGAPTNASLGTTKTDTFTIDESDMEPTVSFDLASESLDENSGAFMMTVDLSAASGVDTTIPFMLSGTAVGGTNYSGVTASPLVIPAGSTSGTISGSILDDGVFNTTNNTLVVTLGTPTNATLGTAKTNTLTIDESDLEPTVAFATSVQSVAENAGTFSITVDLLGRTAVDTTIPFMLSGTAVAGTNYSGVTTSPLVIPAGMTSGTITGTILDDGKYNVNNTLIVTLGTPANATPGAITTDTLTIDESDSPPTVSFGIAAQSVNENAGTFSMTVDLSAASGFDTAVNFSLGGTAALGTNYRDVTNSPLVIPAGSMSGTITGTILDDGVFSPNHTLIASIVSATNATPISPASDTLTIDESDPVPSVSFATATQSVNENAGTFSMTVKLSAVSGVDTSIPFTLGGTAVLGTNYRDVINSPLVIPAGSMSGTITGTVIDDGKYDTSNHTFIVTLGTPINATLGATPADTLTIDESDPQPSVSLALAAQSVNENGGTFSMTVNLSAASAVDTSIPFTLGGTAVAGTNYRDVTATPLVIPAGSVSGTITGTVLDDGKYDATNNTLIVTLGAPTNASLGVHTSDTLTIDESDAPPSVAFAMPAQSVDQSAGTFTVTVKLSTASLSATSVPFTIGGTAVAGTDYAGVTASPLVIPAGSTSATIIGTLLPSTPVGTETIVLTLGTPSGAGLGSTTSDTLTVDVPPTFLGLSHTAFAVGMLGSFTIAASGSPSITISEDPNDTLPDGVKFDPATGLLKGTPATTSAGIYSLHFTASNGAGETAQRTFTLTVLPFSNSGTTLLIDGTGGNDLFLLQFVDATHFVANLNGLHEDFSTSQVTTIDFVGGGGIDTAEVFGDPGTISAKLSPGSGQITTPDATINISDVFGMYIYAGSDSTAMLNDGAGTTGFVATTTYAYEGSQNLYFNMVVGFGSVTAESDSGASDLASFYSGVGATVNLGPATSSLTIAGIEYQAKGFPVAYAYGSATGGDQALLHGSTGNDAFLATPTYAYMSGPTFFEVAVGFQSVRGVGGGGTDIAYLFDSAGDDHVAVSDGAAGIAGSSFENIAQDFALILAYHSGGDDQVRADEIPQDGNTLTTDAGDHETTLTGPGGVSVVKGFGAVAAISSAAPPASAVDFVIGTLENWS